MGETSDNLPGVPGVGPKTAAKWIHQYDGLDNVITNADEIKGKAGEIAARAPRRRDPQPPAQRAGLRPRPLDVTPTDLAAQPWDRQEVHTLFDGLEFRVLRDRLFETLESEEEIDDSGFELDVTQAGRRARSRTGSPSTPGRPRVGVARARDLGLRHRRRASVALAAGDGAAAWVDAAEVSPEDDAALAAWLADAGRPRCCTTPRGRCWRWRPAAGRCTGWTATPRCRRTSSGPTSAPTTWPT